MSGFKVGIVRLGRAAGKTKYSLLDEEDIALVERYAFEARLEVDANGNGVRILAWAYHIGKGRASGQYLHELLWEKHRGGIAAGWKVVHKNGITVDNRLDNLAIIHSSKSYTIHEELHQKFTKEHSLYWAAIKQLPDDPIQEHMMTDPFFTRFCNANGEITEGGCLDENVIFFECHYPPCTNMEKNMREYSICGRCQEVRYCGINCQQCDWPAHKKYCKERRKSFIIDNSLDR